MMMLRLKLDSPLMIAAFSFCKTEGEESEDFPHGAHCMSWGDWSKHSSSWGVVFGSVAIPDHYPSGGV